MNMTSVYQLISTCSVSLIIVGLFLFYSKKSGIFYRNSFHHNSYITIMMNVTFIFSVFLFVNINALQLLKFQEFKNPLFMLTFILVPSLFSLGYSIYKLRAIKLFRKREQIKFYKSIHPKTEIQYKENNIFSVNFLKAVRSEIINNLNNKNYYNSEHLKVEINGIIYVISLGGSFKNHFESSIMNEHYFDYEDTAYSSHFSISWIFNEIQKFHILKDNKIITPSHLLKVLGYDDLAYVHSGDLDIYEMMTL